MFDAWVCVCVKCGNSALFNIKIDFLHMFSKSFFFLFHKFLFFPLHFLGCFLFASEKHCQFPHTFFTLIICNSGPVSYIYWLDNYKLGKSKFSLFSLWSILSVILTYVLKYILSTDFRDRFLYRVIYLQRVFNLTKEKCWTRILASIIFISRTDVNLYLEQ